ncbi:MAG: DNA topoisomerase I [Euryarchaeota archaeon]|nr:DNA topoisomerase I [Euryarchaeota archaeon]
MATLVIAEKNDAARRIASILSQGSLKRSAISKVPVYSFERGGEEYSVVGLRGHILRLDYPKRFARWHADDISALVWAEPERNVAAHSIVGALEVLGQKCGKAILATDYDREGELIGVEALWIVLKKNPDIAVKRARFSAFTRYEVETAFSSLTEVDHALARAAEARQIIDLAWGAALTRFMSLTTGQYGRDFLSVGRVQSPTLALIADREKEIAAFVPKPYWEVIATLKKERDFTAKHERGSIWEKPEVDALMAQLAGAASGTVAALQVQEKKDYPPSPFNTTTFLAEASRLGLSATMAMSIAEKLYIDGYISYPRTDNTVYPPSINLDNVLKELQGSEFKAEAARLLKERRQYPSRGKVTATDHPPIYPVAAATKKKLKADTWQIYELVVRRFFATVAPDALARETRAVIDILGEKFEASGREILFKGWYEYYPYYSPREAFIPALSTGEKLPVAKMEAIENRTRPPNRYSQGNLIQEMERLGLGTKSTRHEIVQKLFERRYVEGNPLRATEGGIAVVNALETSAEHITQHEMTALLEEEMTRIAEGKKELDVVVTESQEILSKALVALESNKHQIRESVRGALAAQKRIGRCQSCGSDLVVRWSKRKKRFVGCSAYPKCKTTYPLPQNGLIVPMDDTCDHCKAPMIKLVMRGRSPRRLCINMECTDERKQQAIKASAARKASK